MIIKGIFRCCTLTYRKQKKQNQNLDRVFTKKWNKQGQKESTKNSEEKVVVIINIFAPIILTQQELQWQHLLLKLQNNMIFASTLRFSSRSPQSEIYIDLATCYHIWASASRNLHFSSVPEYIGTELSPLFHTRHIGSFWCLTGCRRTVWHVLKNVWRYKLFLKMLLNHEHRYYILWIKA